MAEKQFSVDHVESYLPHRKPFLFVDHADINEDKTKVWTHHAFLPEEPYFEGHFPNDPIVPGVVLLECLAQSAHLLLSFREGRMMPGYLVSVESANFNAMVRPGQTVRFEAKLIRQTGELSSGEQSGRIFTFKAAGYLGNDRCLRANINVYQTKNSHNISGQTEIDAKTSEPT